MSELNNFVSNKENVVEERINIYVKDSEILYKGYKNQLHTLEPTGIRMVRLAIIRAIICDVTMDLYAHNGKEMRFLRRILPGGFSYIAAEERDVLFLDISKTVSPEHDPVQKFEFVFVLYRDSYEMLPIFDIRNNKRISKNVIEDEERFKEVVFNFHQTEKGMVMISENFRIFIFQCKNIPKNLKPTEILSFYESILKSYNELGGFNEGSKEKALRPRGQHIFLTTIINQLDLIEVDSQKISVKPELTFFYFNDLQGMMDTFALLFEPWWNLNNEWKFMYPKHFTEITEKFKLLWGDSREEFETSKVRTLYENYFILKDSNVYKKNLTPSYLKIYFLITLEELLGADFIGKTEILFRRNNKNKYEDFLQGIEYIIFSISKNYLVNILSYANMFGFCIYDQLIINKIIDNSKNMFFYIPRNENFKIYDNTSIPVVLKTLYVNEGILRGMATPNSKINIILNYNKSYETKTDFQGKFYFKFPLDLRTTDIICVTSKEPYKIESTITSTSPSTELEDNVIKFLGAGDYEIVKIIFDTSKMVLEVISTGIEANIRFSSEEYISFVLLDSKGDIKVQAEILGKDNANKFSKILNCIEFEYSDEITLFYKEKGRVIISNFDDKEVYHPEKDDQEFYKIELNGLSLIE